MNRVTYKYGPGDRVKILAVDMIGQVDSLSTNQDGNKYRVVFWNNGRRYSEWMYDWEITKAPKEDER